MSDEGSIARSRAGALLLALVALLVSQVDWARLGHWHAAADGESPHHHHHAHLGAHHHGPPSHEHGHEHEHEHEPSFHAPEPSEPEESRRSDEPEDEDDAPGVYIASLLLLGLDLHAPIVVDAPTPARQAVAPTPRRPRLSARHEPANPRGPPTA